MTIQTIIDLLHGSSPFTLRRGSRLGVVAPHPDFMALAPSKTFLVLGNRGDRAEFIRINQIGRIEVANDSAAA